MHVPPSLQQLKAAGETAAAHCAHQTHRELEARKRQAAWYAAATDYHPLDATQQQPRADGALLQRVRLGYCTREELPGLRGASVAPLRDAHPRPLCTKPPGRARHRPPEARPGPRRPACSGGADGLKAGPALMVPHPERRCLGCCEQRPLPADTSRPQPVAPAG
ncbi:hypothetical protein GWK47_023455 [Chionoecetes opilio]|uniref:Uncharacterized protein n=1 Tax=Chionoecetes opilio TaxID=41210 RepID=A0A8J5CD40_CHIOP|nr:hypothetical protein GWK47_023455 [Chionoecetes opilio]